MNDVYFAASTALRSPSAFGREQEPRPTIERIEE
jgi:hypothetical protein